MNNSVKHPVKWVLIRAKTGKIDPDGNYIYQCKWQDKDHVMLQGHTIDVRTGYFDYRETYL